MTPHFTILVWGSVGSELDKVFHRLGLPRPPREPLCVIEVDSTIPGDLTIMRHRGLELRPQKMLTRHAN
jgi:hypothetical protein